MTDELLWCLRSKNNWQKEEHKRRQALVSFVRLSPAGDDLHVQLLQGAAVSVVLALSSDFHTVYFGSQAWREADNTFSQCSKDTCSNMDPSSFNCDAN